MSKTVHIFSKTGGILKYLSNKNLPVTFNNIEVLESEDHLTEEKYNALQNAEILVTEPTLVVKYKLANSLPNLKWMQLTWAGIDDFMKSLDTVKPLPDYKLTRFGGYFGNHMAEFVIAHMIAYERDFVGMKKQQELCKWANSTFNQYRLLQELQIGILGAGDIGKEVAKTCKDFKMTVWGMVNHVVPTEHRPPYIDHYRTVDGLSDILENCDWLCCILPSTPQTRQLLSGEALSICKKKPVLVNLGRGDLINEESIINALDKEWISHAILDVCHMEPLPAESSLWNHPKVTIAPHVSACSFDWQIADGVAENVRRYLAGETLRFEVNLEKGY